MNDDAVIAKICFDLSLKWLEELKSAPDPLSYGLAQKFQSFIPKGNLEDLYNETDPNWWGYAATMEEFSEMMAIKPKQDFVPKKGRLT